ncbi:hypothetical protein Forpe1208_v006911 [Fusarium oxysporum f. sp. rapae]|uniref:CCHC-type domain-containing protein n=1 Tax=Fusarium oxysporum f. sp. rapae TaxID=485398 RepID=A0A8J5NYI3_FUSOX|nr:hypothetical protein Forpe1208_v006911 [Fusarium oxysporum f. sp. rapae]
MAWKRPLISRAERSSGMPVDLLHNALGDGIPRLAPFNGLLEDDEDMCDDANRATSLEPVNFCGNCNEPGHRIIQCWKIGENGFVYGCGVCNSPEHATERCQGFPQDTAGRFDILVKQRGALPPLQGKFWYPLMWKYVRDNPGVGTNHLLPWTTEFSRTILHPLCNEDMNRLLFARNNPQAERREFLVDPATETWDKAKETYLGEPKNWYRKIAEEKKAREEAGTGKTDRTAGARS